MEKTLLILEVSRKQDYIFGGKRLRDNVSRSQDIRTVTNPCYFAETAQDLYTEKENLVYSGGGHAVLQFPSEEAAKRFTERITEAAILEFEGMELYAKMLPFDEGKSPRDNLRTLISALEEKKALRKSSFRRGALGIEELSTENFRPVDMLLRPSRYQPEPVEAPDGFFFPADLEKVAGEDNFIGVVHVDGNAMGARVAAVQGKVGNDWEACRRGMQRFSQSIQASFETAFRDTLEEMIERLSLEPAPTGEERKPLPIRPVVLAGDDVCFITAGFYGLEAAAIFLNHLSRQVNPEDGKPYAACAGVALVHTKYPFHRAYRIAEELCSSAKRYGVSLKPDGSVCTMDWHIEYGQLHGSLHEIRETYETQDGKRMELRPVTVIAPEGLGSPYRRYDFLRGMTAQVKKNTKGLAHGKLKELRNAIRQGELETRYFLREKEISSLMDYPFDAVYDNAEKRREQFGAQIHNRKLWKKGAFFVDEENRQRSLLFDPIEISDHFELLREADT